jgi:hypothetical protein
MLAFAGIVAPDFEDITATREIAAADFVAVECVRTFEKIKR